MTNQVPNPKKILSEQAIAMLIRWWAAGAVYFFIGWGTGLGQQDTIIDFVLTLGMVMGLFNILILNRILRMMFNLGPKRPEHENTFAQRLSDHLVELVKNVFIVLVVAGIYLGLNQSIISLRGLPEDAVPLPGEPILFGLFYVAVFWLLQKIGDWIRSAFAGRRTEGGSR